MRIWPALALDVIGVLVFAILGRSNHHEASDVLGVLRTAWPFLAGCLLGVGIGRTWRRPASMPAAVVVWVCTVVLGMTLRVLTGGGTQLSFILVTTIVLAVFFFGWRAGLRAISTARRRSRTA